MSRFFPLTFSIILADDDKDDCELFKEILEELPFNTALTTFHNGEHLMQMLHKKSTELPHAIFLDINMPRKNGFECLTEIKSNEKLMHIPVIIYSTSYEQEVADLMYKNGAQFYIRNRVCIRNFKK